MLVYVGNASKNLHCPFQVYGRVKNEGGGSSLQNINMKINFIANQHKNKNKSLVT
jgi:hypothetical protein